MKDTLNAEDKVAWEEATESGTILYSAMKYMLDITDIPEHLKEWKGQASGANFEMLVATLLLCKSLQKKQPNIRVRTSWILPIIAEKNVNGIDEQVQLGADPHFIDKAGMTPIMHLINEFPRDHSDDSLVFAFTAFKRLLQLSRDRQIDIVNSGTPKYRSPLHYACKNPLVSYIAVHMLLLWGARVNCTGNVRLVVPPIHDAVANDRLDIVQLLEEYGADVNHTVEIEGKVVSTLSCCRSIGMFHALLTLGAVYNFKLHCQLIFLEANKKCSSVTKNLMPGLNLMVYFWYFLQTAFGFVIAFLVLLSHSPITSVALALSIAPEHTAVLITYPGAVIYSKLSKQPDFSVKLAVTWFLMSLLLVVNDETLRYLLCILLARIFTILEFDSFAIILYSCFFFDFFFGVSYIPMWTKAACLRLFFLFWSSLSWCITLLRFYHEQNTLRYEVPEWMKQYVLMSFIGVNLVLLAQPPYDKSYHNCFLFFGIDRLCFYDGSVSPSLCNCPFAGEYHPYLWKYLNFTTI
jgi:ankyrin repeat protein